MPNLHFGLFNFHRIYFYSTSLEKFNGTPFYNRWRYDVHHDNFICCFSLFGLAKNGGHMATQPMTWKTIIPKFDLKYWSTVGMLIYAVNGCELIAPYITKMKQPKRDFPKAMIALSIMTAFLTIFGSFALGIYFNAYHLPNDLKMNGSYYAFQALGQQLGVGKLFMYIYAWTSVLYMCALLAVLLDAMTRMLISDTGDKFMPKFLRKTNSDGLPINGYILTSSLSAFIMLLGYSYQK